MRLSKTMLIIASLIFCLSSTVLAQSLEKRHQIGLKVGWFNQVTDALTEVDITGVTTSVKNNGPLGTVFYEHWLRENLALNIGIGGMIPDVSVSTGVTGVTTETANITQIFLGAKYYLPESTYGSNVRPFLSVSAGPVIGTINSIQAGLITATDSRTEATMGGNLGGGVDFILSRHFMLGSAVGYTLMSDFAESIGGSKNYSGPQFTISFGYLFGKGTK